MKKKELVKKLAKRDKLINDLLVQLSAAQSELHEKASVLEQEREELNKLKFDYAQLEECVSCLTLMTDVQREAMRSTKNLTPKQVISSKENKSTILLWDDGSKTEIKCSEKDEFSPLAGIALGFLKKILSHKVYNRLFVRNELNVIDRDALHEQKKPAKKAKTSKKAKAEEGDNLPEDTISNDLSE